MPIDAAATRGHPPDRRVSGASAPTDIHADTYTSQMLDLFRRTGVSSTRWVLAPGGGINLITGQRPHVPNSQGEQMGAGLS